MNCDEIRILLSALVDNDLFPEEKKMVAEHLVDCAECRKEYSRLMKLKEVTEDMKYFDLPDRLRAGYWHGIYNRIERGAGWIFLSIGVIILLAIGAWELLQNFYLNPTVPIILRVGLAALLLGLIILLVSLIRERLFSRTHDRYEEVEL